MKHPLIAHLEFRLEEAENALKREQNEKRQYSAVHTSGYISALKVAIVDARRFLS